VPKLVAPPELEEPDEPEELDAPDEPEELEELDVPDEPEEPEELDVPDEPDELEVLDEPDEAPWPSIPGVCSSPAAAVASPGDVTAVVHAVAAPTNRVPRR
jgi:hypothetical protein